MTTETTLTNQEILTSTIEEWGLTFQQVVQVLQFARAIKQAVLQSPEVQRLKAIETAAREVLSIPREDGYTVLTVHLDALRAALEQNQGG